MKVTVLEVADDAMKFIVEEIDAAFANSLRRTMISDVPTMAVDDIFYYDNTSVIPDEVLAHRIGLIPLKTDLQNYNLPEQCDCKSDLGCPKCRVTLSLSIKAEDETRVVYSGDMISVDPAVIPVNPYIPLAKLAPGQAISLEAYAQLGRGKHHTKWSPVATTIFHNTADIKADEASATKCLEESKKAVIAHRGGVKIVDIEAFNQSQACRSLLNGSSLKEHMRNDEFVFVVESTGALPPKKIVSEAVSILIGKVEELRSKIDANTVHDEIEDFEAPTEVGRRLYSIGAGDFDEEDEEGEGGETTFDEQ